MLRPMSVGPKSFRDAFSGMSDDDWYKVMLRSVQERIIDGIAFAGFPAEDIQVRMVGSSNANALHEANRFYRFVKEECAQYGQPLRPDSRLLDFGVGWGRMIRFFLKDVDPEGLYGVDVNDKFLAICRDIGVVANLLLIDPLGSLPYEDRFFDLVYAYSVFTHLPERVADVWLAEITRILKPGGMLIATVEPRRFLEFCRSITPEMAAKSGWHNTLTRAFHLHPDPFGDYDRRGIVYLTPTKGNADNELYGDTVVSPEYVSSHWGRYVDVKTYLDDKDRFWQAVVVAQKRNA